MKVYDLIIVGAATSGLYLARKMAKRGYTVKVIEKLPEEKAGTRMDIFHVTRTDFIKFDIPLVREGDPEWAFEFTDNHFSSPSNKYHINVDAETVGLHMKEYVALMAKLAREAGAEIEYDAAFEEFTFSSGAISGIRYSTPDGIKEDKCKVAVDCSGIASAARRALPNGYGVENFKIEDEDLLFVLLRYARFDGEQMNTFWLNMKSWYAPFSMDGKEKIIGTGASGSMEKVRREAEKLDGVSSHGEFELVKTEEGATPYRRPPYSLVADNFIAAGDAACLTKPDCGEGVTSSMVMLDIAADVLHTALKQGRADKEALWDINCRYNRAQGAEFAMVRAFLTKFINTVTDDELEYCFRNRIIFNETFLNNGDVTPKDAIQTVVKMIGGISRKGVSLKTVGAIVSGARLAFELRTHYMNFPKNPEAFPVWASIAERMWKKVGKVK
ncbi:MAG: NAD(P)/FAD-dependent oxidoreductase [Clostridia bacterium]|nr:NAD(P)/FAD-dependent oxidoreductase [Clostridia bacterium]